MNVSIVINHYRSPEVLKLALTYALQWKEAFEQSPEKQGKLFASIATRRAEIIVTDSETNSETREMMREYFPAVTFLEEQTNIGFGRSVNRALQKARGEYIFMMNADIVIPRPQELDKLIGYLQNNPDIGITGPKLLNFDETHQPSAFRFYTPGIIALRRIPLLRNMKWGTRMLDAFTLAHHKHLLSSPTPVDWLMGSALLTKKEYLERIGPFDERFFMYMEDVDLCRRFWENKLKIMYYPLATMYHYHKAASRSRNIFAPLTNKYTRIHLMSAYKYFRKHGLKTPRYGV